MFLFQNTFLHPSFGSQGIAFKTPSINFYIFKHDSHLKGGKIDIYFQIKLEQICYLLINVLTLHLVRIMLYLYNVEF
ncbi:hypothetical protein BH10BAC5_BH10BAC5_10420 [soil metagenome]